MHWICRKFGYLFYLLNSEFVLDLIIVFKIKKKVSLWTLDYNSDIFEPRLICESEDLDGEVTELKVKLNVLVFFKKLNKHIYF